MPFGFPLEFARRNNVAVRCRSLLHRVLSSCKACGFYRIGALMVVAVIAFAASFLYQRFAERTR